MAGVLFVSQATVSVLNNGKFIGVSAQNNVEFMTADELKELLNEDSLPVSR